LIPDQIGRNPGLQAIWEDEKQRRREKNQVSHIETPESQGEQTHRGNCSKQRNRKLFYFASFFSVLL